MLLLVTVALVLAGLVLLIVGFVQDSLSLIYLSIACAAVAGIALIVFSRLSRRRAVRLALDGVPAAAAPPSPILTRPRPLTERQPVYGGEEAAPAARAEPAYADDYLEEEVTPVPAAPQPVRPAPGFEREPVPEMAASVPGSGHWEEQGEWQEDWGDEVVFPIEDYDELRVAEIMPLLPQLEPDELEDVRDREVNTKARAMIISRIDELLGVEEAPLAAATRAAAPRRAVAGSAKRASTGRAGAGAPAKRAAASPKTAAAPARGASKAAAASGRAAKSAAGTASTAAKKAVAAGRAGTAQRKAPAPSKAAASRTAAGKTAASRTAASRTTTSKAAPAKATTGRAPAKTAVGKAAAAKKVARTTKAAPTKAAQPVKKAAKKATGGSTGQPRKR